MSLRGGDSSDRRAVIGACSGGVGERQPDLPMAFRRGCCVVPGDMMIDWVTPARGGAAAQSLWVVRGAGGTPGGGAD